ncbi:MAG: lipopolysaccharide biosynthesis protein [Actinomycetota bacterium]|nr:lipopolysaccharide biosynthesis protein [Actinomycetota bacterium]
MGEGLFVALAFAAVTLVPEASHQPIALALAWGLAALPGGLASFRLLSTGLARRGPTVTVSDSVACAEGDRLSRSPKIAISSAVAGGVANADLWIAGLLLGSVAAAPYGVGLRVAAVLAVPLALVNQAVPPLIPRLLRDNRRGALSDFLGRLTAMTLCPGIVVMLVILVAGDEIMSLLFGSAYASAWILAAILGLGQLANLASGPAGNVLLFAGEERDHLVGTVLGALFGLSAAVGLGSAFGLIGIAAGAALGQAVKNLWYAVATRSRTGVTTWARWSSFRTMRTHILLRTLGASQPDGDG